MEIRRTVLIGLVVMWLVSCVTPIPTVSPISPLMVKTPTPAPTPSGGLLANPSFEAPYECPAHSADCAAHGWTAWWTPLPYCMPYNQDKTPNPNCNIKCPDGCGYCNHDYGCWWKSPEFAEATLDHPERVLSGLSAQKSFTYGGQGEWGVYQRVHVPANSWLKFSVYIQTWMCHDFIDCQYGKISDQPTTMHTKIGIDSWGGIVPTSTVVAWSEERDSFDKYSQYSIVAQAQGEWITVFIYIRPDWDWVRVNNDAYFDDASLFIVAPLDQHIYLPGVFR